MAPASPRVPAGVAEHGERPRPPLAAGLVGGDVRGEPIGPAGHGVVAEEGHQARRAPAATPALRAAAGPRLSWEKNRKRIGRTIRRQPRPECRRPSRRPRPRPRIPEASAWRPSASRTGKSVSGRRKVGMTTEKLTPTFQPRASKISSSVVRESSRRALQETARRNRSRTARRPGYVGTRRSGNFAKISESDAAAPGLDRLAASRRAPAWWR